MGDGYLVVLIVVEDVKCFIVFVDIEIDMFVFFVWVVVVED